MNKTALLVIFLDLFVLLAISSLIAGGFVLMGAPWLAAFLITLGTVFILGIASNAIMDATTTVKIRKSELETARVLATQVISCNCAYCRTPNELLFRTDREMTFECAGCHQTNKIVWQYGSARITTPIDLKVPTLDIVPNEELDKDKD